MISHYHVIEGPHPDAGWAPDVDEAHTNRRRARLCARCLVQEAREIGHRVQKLDPGWWEVDDGSEYGRFIQFLDGCERPDCFDYVRELLG